MKPWESDHEIIFDHAYTEYLNQQIREQFPVGGVRNATHASDLLFCLRKAWARIHDVEPEGEIDDDTVLTWAGGLTFERLISEGTTQGAMAYCFECKAVSGAPGRTHDGREVDTCPVCKKRWLVGTPDYIIDGILHEVKQTRKSQRGGVPPLWVDQLRTYLLFKKRGGNHPANWTRVIPNWLMGDYGFKKKGWKGRPPRSSLEAWKIVFLEGFEEPWHEELFRRKLIVEGDEMPPLNGMGEGDEQVPAFPFECASCQVGKQIGCEMYIWDDEGKEISIVELSKDGS